MVDADDVLAGVRPVLFLGHALGLHEHDQVARGVRRWPRPSGRSL